MIQVTGSNSLDEAPSKRGTKDHWLACHTQAQTKVPPTSDVFVASNKTLFANRALVYFFAINKPEYLCCFEFLNGDFCV